MSTEKNNRPANMSQADYDALSAAGDRYNNATTDEERVQAHADAEAIRAKYNYSGGADGSQNITTNRTEAEARQQSYADVVAEANKAGNTGLANAANEALRNATQQVQPVVQQVPQIQQVQAPQLTAQVPDFTGLLDAWMNSAKEQQYATIDYATQQGIKELERAEADAQEQFDTQQNQINIDEAKALDNQALYAEARGDKGGIGAAQYGQIQATAMTNRRAINSARTKLSTDTARAIADLRAQGEFEKADKLLTLTQTYLAQLMELQQWGAEYALSVDQFNIQLQQWQAEYNMEVQKYLTGLEQWDKEFNYMVDQDEQNRLIEQGNAMLAAGIRPSASQQQAMGYTDDQIDAYIAQYKLEQANKNKSGGSNPSDVTGIEPVGGTGLTGLLVQMYKAGIKTETEAYYYLRNAGITQTDAEKYVEDYMAKLDDGSMDRAANDAPKVDLSDIPSWVLTDVRERMMSEGGSNGTMGVRMVEHLQTLIDKKIITEDQAVRIGASFGLPY